NYLPAEVHLYDPTGNSETIFYFRECEINKWDLNPFKDPFNPKLFGYKAIVHPVPALPGPQADPKKSFSVVGLHYKEAQKIVEARGKKSVIKRGTNASAPEQVYHVQHQEENAAGQVVLTLYDTVK